MKVLSVLVLFAAAVMASSQFVPPLGGVVPPVGGILPPIIPPPFFGPFFPPFFPFFRPFFGLRRFGMFPFLGKRDTEAVNGQLETEKVADKIAKAAESQLEEMKKMQEETQKVVDEQKKVEARGVEQSVEQQQIQQQKQRSTEEPRTLCQLNAEQLRCNGARHTFECRVQPQIAQLRDAKLRLADLRIVRGEQQSSFNLVGRQSEFTAVNPVDNEKVTLSLFNVEDAKLAGFRVQDEQCWRNVESLVKEVAEDQIRVSLVLNQQ